MATTSRGHIERLPSGSLQVKVYIGNDRQETGPQGDMIPILLVISWIRIVTRIWRLAGRSEWAER